MLIDYHVHNHFSPDSWEKTPKILDQATRVGLNEICLTNHAERHHHETGNSIFDGEEAENRFRKIKTEIDKIQPQYPTVKIKFGVELGYLEGRMKELADFVQKTDFDFVLGSVHIVKDVIIASQNFAHELYSQTDEETAYKAYFEKLWKLVEWGHFDVASHFDINKKIGHQFYGPFAPEKYSAQIYPILELMGKKGIGLELNAKCMHSKCREIFPHPTILRWALAAGIEHFTVSSDAHRAEHVGQHLPEALEIAKTVGIKYLSTYSKRKPTHFHLS